MDYIKAMTIFSEVASQNSFAAAARRLNISTSAASRHIADLEEWMGVQLFHRTTRYLKLTQDGAESLNHCKQVLAEIEKLKNRGEDSLDEPHGVLRITAPVYLTKYWLVGPIGDYLKQHPRVSIDLVVADRNINLVSEGFDLGIRVGKLSDSTLLSKKLGNTQMMLVASPDYLEKHGYPESPADLKNHRCIVDTVASFGERWPFRQQGKSKVVIGKKIIRVNSGEIACEMAIAGLGISLSPNFIADKAVSDKRLVSLLDNDLDKTRMTGIFVVYPSSRHVSNLVRSFIDFLSELDLSAAV